MGRHLGWVAAVLAASVAFGVSGASAGRVDPPGDRDANHCINSFGVDLNELYGISDQFRVFECREVTAGEHWRVLLTWFTNFADAPVYPAGYVPSEPAPLDDFVGKLVAVKMVLDGGTAQERTLLFSPGEAVRTDIDASELQPGTEPFPLASMIPRLPPLSAGDHTWQPFIVLGAQHCDGFAPVVDENCLPAGETAFGPPRPLTISRPVS